MGDILNWENFKIVGAVLGTVSFGFTLGRHVVNTEQKRLTRAEAVKMVQDLLSQLTVKDDDFKVLAPDTAILRHGQRLKLGYTIENRADHTLDVWLGASLLAEGQDPDDKENWLYNTDEDSPLFLNKGLHELIRYLVIKPEWEPGTYMLSMEVWFGPLSKDRHSILVAQNRKMPRVVIENSPPH